MLYMGVHIDTHLKHLTTITQGLCETLGDSYCVTLQTVREEGIMEPCKQQSFVILPVAVLSLLGQHNSQQAQGFK